MHAKWPFLRGLGHKVVVVFEHGLFLALFLLLSLPLLLFNVALPALLPGVTRRFDSLLLVILLLCDVVGSNLGQFFLVLAQKLLGCQTLTSGDIFAIEAHNLGDLSDDVLSEVLPVGARIACKVHLLQVLTPFHLFTGLLEVFQVDEVESHVEFVEALAPLDARDFDN